MNRELDGARTPEGWEFPAPGGGVLSVPASYIRSVAKAKGVTEDEAAGMFIDAVRDEMDSVAGRVPDDASGAAGEWVVRPDHPVPDDTTGDAHRNDHIAYSTNGRTEFHGIPRTPLGTNGWAASPDRHAVRTNRETLASGAATRRGRVTHCAVFSGAHGGMQRTAWRPLRETPLVRPGDRIMFSAGRLEVRFDAGVSVSASPDAGRPYVWVPPLV